MNTNLNSPTNEAILKRHIERIKMKESLASIDLSNSRTLLKLIKTDNNIDRISFPSFEVNRLLATQRADDDELLPIDATQFSLFNNSPPMDLDEIESYSEDEPEIDDDEKFREWFLKYCSGRSENEDIICQENDYILVEMKMDNIIVKCTRECSVLNSQTCWILIRMLCKLHILHILTFSTKPLIKSIISSCETTLKLKKLDIGRVISFMCDHPFYDMKLAHSLLSPGKKLESSNDLRIYVNQGVSDVEDVFNFDVLSIMKNIITKLKSLNYFSVYKEIICPSNVVLAILEYTGIQIDMDLWSKTKTELEVSLKLLESEARDAEPSLISLSSPLHIREIIYSKLKLHEHISNEERRQSGMDHLIKIRSTNEVVLSKLKQFHRLPNIIIKFRRISRIKAIYVDSFSTMMDHKNYVIKGDWDQTSSVSGRIFCSRPNLQALPRDSEDENNIDIKSIFMAPKEYLFVSADFCQIELRIFANLSKDAKLTKLFQETDTSQTDIFDNLSKSLVIRVGDNVSERQITKKVLYGCLYGVGAQTLAETLWVAPSSASDLLRRVNVEFPSIKAFTKKCKDNLQSLGYLETITGRKRYFKIDCGMSISQQIEVGRQMVNYVIQGSAADICKIVMVECQKMFGYKCIDAHLILTRHDELVWIVHSESLASTLEVVTSQMNITKIFNKFTNYKEDVILTTPMKVKMKKGKSLKNMESF